MNPPIILILITVMNKNTTTKYRGGSLACPISYPQLFSYDGTYLVMQCAQALDQVMASHAINLLFIDVKASSTFLNDYVYCFEK